MSEFRFRVLCGAVLIEPSLALENENIVAALKAGDGELVQRLLETEF